MSAMLRRGVALLRPVGAQISRSTFRPAAVAGARAMSGRVPLPTPAWKQADNLDTIVPSDMDQATGLERAEMLAGLEGRKIFEDEAITGPFGTEAAPVMVESIYDERIVGCPGDCASGDTVVNNELKWFVVSSKAPYKCAACGQVFALKKVAGEEYKF